MWKHGLLFIAMAVLPSDVASQPAPELVELSPTIGEESVQILGRVTYGSAKDCSTIRTQRAIWEDASRKSPMLPRPRIGLGVGLQEKAKNLWDRQCYDEASKLYEQAAKAYGEVIQLSAGDNSPVSRTFRLQASMNLATIFIQVGEYDAARGVLAATLNERDAYLPAITRLAEVELRMGRPAEALAVTDRLRDKPYEDIGGLSVGQFWALRADAHCQLGFAEEANREIKLARRNDPNVREAQCRNSKGD